MTITKTPRTAGRKLALVATLAGTMQAIPRRNIHRPGARSQDWAADPARVGHEPGYTWQEPDGTMRCVHCGYGPCREPRGHHLSAGRAAA